ncbi:hypothetical protein AYR54_03885 [Loigolactobacillus backii]|uniref:DUF1788 domain-containing protein n=1 Tax=Loigolactobacillus backii TaxID=375175 RepID=UPI0007F12A6A|nr:DUF1788 domain-containing protein [Loigolactobacillus backii]ANK59458.1 hypothetical protein AYR52_03875 [Loigolactobacillus backii]ANK64451.1 hypothetical protein AYR54_03885 [Loigolactobacillus backii]ANK67153.1 hypothetical protein AYR55_05150 [Loigolactobacillus backii]OLF69502.1 hypothetical protein ACX53_07635 [Loigolactobacillus backii]PIO87798.1 hypothetical protein B8A32_11905 [Loigolactobacillus backii]
MRTTAQRLNALQDKLLAEQFVHNTGLGNEVGFYIFDYVPQDELLVRARIVEIQQYTEKRLQVKIQNFDLFKIVLQFFESRGYMDKNFQMEAKRGSAILFERMQKALKLATNRDELVGYITAHYDPNAIIFLTGVGTAYPIVRSHNLLNNLQPLITQMPLVLFYPGTYSYNKLKLFDQLDDDHYYRAFRIVGD